MFEYHNLAEGAVVKDQLFDVSGKVCLITGTSSGLGAHFAKVLSARGAKVVGMSRAVGAATGSGMISVVGDVRVKADIQNALDMAEREFGGVDVVISNAGAGGDEPIGDIGSEQAAEVFQTNVTGGAILAQEAMHRMRAGKRPGSIIHVSSTLAQSVMPSLAVYAASKAALDHLMRNQAQAWARHGVRVNALAPGWFETDMTREAFDRGLRPILKAKTPLRRIGEFADLDGPLLLLASDASRFMTGTTIVVDGGYCIG